MTEVEWQTSTSPGALFARAGVNPRDRRVLLYAAHLLRGRPELLTPSLKVWVEVAEDVCEGMLGGEVFDGGFQAEAEGNSVQLAGYGWRGTRAFYAAVTHVVHYVGGDPDEFQFDVPPEELEPVRRSCADVIRDILGNPFRPVEFSASWRTSTAVALARTMYESRDFGAMPIVADALQDAGCDSDDVLNHCRDTKQVHVRGCWVADLVLGRE